MAKGHHIDFDKMTRGQVQDTLRALSRADIRLKSGDVAQLKEQHPNIYARLRPEQVEHLTPDMIERLTLAQLKELTPTQIQEFAAAPVEVQDKILTRENVDAMTREIFCSDEALEYARKLMTAANITQNAAIFLHSPTRDIRAAAIYGVIEADYSNETIIDPRTGAPILDTVYRLQMSGLTDATAYNMGPLSEGRSNSNVQAIGFIERSVPHEPMFVLAFRGTKSEPREWSRGVPNEEGYYSDVLSHLFGAVDYIAGKPVGSYEESVQRFAQAALRGDPNDATDGIFDKIDTVIREAEAQGVKPRIIISGHSYGADNAARMAYLIAKQYPEYAECIEFIGFGPTPTLMVEEQLLIYKALMGPHSIASRLDIDRIPDGQQKILLQEWQKGTMRIYPTDGHGIYLHPNDPTGQHEIFLPNNGMAERVYQYRGKKDPFSILNDIMQFVSLDDPAGLGKIVGDTQEGHMDYQAELIRMAVANRATTAIANMELPYARMYLLNAMADLPKEMEAHADDVIYLERKGFERFIRQATIRREHEAREIVSEIVTGDPENAPAVILEENSIKPIAEETSTTTPLAELGDVTIPEGLALSGTGASGVMDDILPVDATLAKPVESRVAATPSH